MKRKFIYLSLMLPLMMASCVIDQLPETPAGETVAMKLDTRAPDTDIDVRLVVTDDATGQVLLNEYPAVADDPQGRYDVAVRTGTLNFYVIANEPARLTPLLGQVRHQSALKELTVNMSELPLTEYPDAQSTGSTNLPVMRKIKARVRKSSTDPQRGEVSTDDGSTWSGVLNAKTERLASKITMGLKKDQTLVGVDVRILKIEVVNIPHWSYVIPRSYDGSEFASLIPYRNPAGLGLEHENYRTLFVNLIVPEHLPRDITQPGAATTLRITARYDGKTVMYTLPIRGDLTRNDYSMHRNKHYLVLANIVSQGEMIYEPSLDYLVSEWDEVHSGSEFVEDAAITFEAEWADGTDLSGSDVHVDNNSCVEFSFSLSNPMGASWAATITNPIDFEFDYSEGAASRGIAIPGRIYKIRVKPRRETSRNDVKTGFFITVNNGTGRNVELNLINETAGTRNGYTIIQIPN